MLFRKLGFIFIILFFFISSAAATYFNDKEIEQKIAKQLPQKISLIPDSTQKKIVIYPLSAYSESGDPCCKDCSASNHAANLMPLFIENALIGHMQVLERRQLDNVLKELKLQFSDLFNFDTAKKVGKFMNADYIIVGDVSYSSCRESYWLGTNTIILRIKFVEIETGIVKAGLLIQ